MADSAPPDTMRSERSIPPELLEELDRTVATVFERAISAWDASSSLEQMDELRSIIRDQMNTTLSHPMRVSNAQLSLQHRLPAELWLDVWSRRPLDGRVAVSHVCSHWRTLIVESPDSWSAIDCITYLWTAPDGHRYCRTTLGIVPLALERAQGFKLSLSFAFHRDYVISDLHRSIGMLAPHSHSVVGIEVTGNIESFQLILQALQPMIEIQWLMHSVPTFDSYFPTSAPILALSSILPNLKVLVLPYHRTYGWPGDGYEHDKSVSRQPRAPALRKLCFSAARDVDITRMLFDCPMVSSLTLALAKYFRVESQDLNLQQLSTDQVTCLYLLEVPVARVSWALSTFNISLRQHAVVSIVDNPPEVTSYAGEFELTHTVWISPPSVASPSYEASLVGDTSRPSKAKQLYRRISSATKGMFRRKRADDAASVADDPPPSEDERGMSPILGSPTLPVSAAPELMALASLFRNLTGPVNVALISQTTCDEWGAMHLGAALKATDDAWRTRIVGLQNLSIFPTLLSCVWEDYLPLALVSCLSAELELFPALVASLPAEAPVSSLELLIAPCEHSEHIINEGSGNASTVLRDVVLPETCERAVFPALRTLRFVLRDVHSAGRSVLRAANIEKFINSLGCRTPVESIILSRGVDVDDASAVMSLASLVILDTHTTHRDPFSL